MQAAGRRSEAGRQYAVRDLAWVMTGPALLAVAHAQGTLLLRDPRGVLGSRV